MEPQKLPGAKFRRTDSGQQKGKPGLRKVSPIRRVMRSVVWLAGGLADWFGRKSVRSGAALIGEAWKGARNGPQRDSCFKVDENGGFDLTATAFSLDINLEALEQRLEQRRRVTCMASYGALFIAVLCMIFWIHSALSQPYTVARVMVACEFLPFISLSLLSAFYNALLNFQVRVRRFASWREFLSTEKEGFFPR